MRYAGVYLKRRKKTKTPATFAHSDFQVSGISFKKPRIVPWSAKVYFMNGERKDAHPHAQCTNAQQTFGRKDRKTFWQLPNARGITGNA